MKTIKLKLPNSLFQQLKISAGQSISQYIIQLLQAEMAPKTSLETTLGYIGKVISGASILAHNNTVVLGGSNYTYVLIGSHSIKNNQSYKIVAFKHGSLYLCLNK